MAFGGLEKKQTAASMAEINMTPLIDVMLVLLVIFIITAPLFTHAIRLDLPKVAAKPARETPQTISLSIDTAGKLYWNGAPITLEQMRARFAQAAKAGTASTASTAAAANTATTATDETTTAVQPEIHLHAERNTRYEVIAQVMGAAQQAGLERIGFVTDPPPAPKQ
ncbi:MAG: Biopolymer transport protein ExbD/TolR [uncultured Paraburkholderia sp.]|nr:MAG: Biopolymer transport protein ExbD/TolR [uncultured Paraburkholderia sp.]CAH2909216.1 MAG: Biopolymer transport protein ExbD/TolR [uncultured Paraburkholderia sp.]